MLQKVCIPKLFIGIGIVTIISATIYIYNLVTIIRKTTLKAERILEEQNHQIDPIFEIINQLGSLLSPQKGEK